jgi:putative ABC transport system permease protein
MPNNRHELSTRGTRWLEDTAGDFAFGVRTLWHNLGFATVAVLTLAIGIGGSTAMFSVVDAVLLEPLPYQQAGQLLRLYQNDLRNPNDRGFVTPVHYLAYRHDMSTFEATAALRTYDETGADIGSGDDVRRIVLLPTSADYFDVVRVRPELGRGFQSEDENGAPVVVLGHRLWKEQFHSDPAAIGRILTMSGQPYTVIGVMPRGFGDPVAGHIDAWVPLDLAPGRDASNADNHYLTIIARLRPGTPLTRSQAELDALSLTLAKQYPGASEVRARLFPLKEDIVGGSSRALEIMLGAVGLVLLLVCVNVANLLLVRGSERAREFALRSALGAERARLVRQLLIESVTLALAGDIAGLIVARIFMSALVHLGSGTIPRLATLTLDLRLLAFSLVIATASALLFGLAPALRAARTQPSDILREHGSDGRGSTGSGAQIRLREWLVVSQVSLAFVLLVGTGLLLSSFQRIRDVNLGVRPDGVLTFEVHLPGARYDSVARGHFYDDFASRLANLHGVRAAGAISKLPATGPYHMWGTQALTGPRANARTWTSAQQRVVAGDYFGTVGIPLLKGRLFDTHDDAGAPDRVVVSKSFADEMFPNVDPIGQRLRTGGRSSEIIGVVGDVAVDNEGRADRYVYHAHRQFAGDRNWSLTQTVRFGDPREASAAQTVIRRALASIDPLLVMYQPAMLDDVIGRGAAQRVFTLRILMAFASVAILLSALGLFGVLSYGVRLRAREFGIRMALGAERGAIQRMVLRRGLLVTVLGVAIGLAGATIVSRLIASVLFHVSALDPTVLAGACVLMIAIASLAAFLPARRATSVDPRSALQ